jgi:hypothetical protein
MTPPGLAWLDSFCGSVGLALGSSIQASTESTVNPLIHTVRLRFGEPCDPKRANEIWNLFQKWAAVNGSRPQGRIERRAYSKWLIDGMSISVMIRERLGAPRNEKP